MKWIPQMEPDFDGCERAALDEYMAAGGWVTEFKKTREFERMIADYTGARYCSVVSNGTVSLITALAACGITAEDEVIVPDYTMAATADAVAILGAKTVFVDIDRRNLCLDFEKMAAAVTPKTKAVMLVTINGRFPEQIERFVSFCKERGIWLIEDAAQSLGSFCGGRHLGTFGDIGSFSFSSPKIITTGQGGALITDNEVLYEKIKKIRDFGRESGGSDHYLTKGWNFKFTDIQAVIGMEQMKKLPQRVERKKEMGWLYKSLLKNVNGVELLPTDFSQTAPWFYDILCEERERLIEYLKNRNIGTRPFYPALHLEPAFDVEADCPVTREISAKGLWLPSSVKVTNEEIEYVCTCIKEFYENETV